MSKFIEHAGTGMPVSGDVMVTVLFKDGDIYGEGGLEEPCPASEWEDYFGINSWTFDHPEDKYHIVGYYING